MGRAAREHSSAEPVRRLRRSVEGYEKKTRAATPQRSKTRSARAKSRPSKSRALPWRLLLVLGLIRH